MQLRERALALYGENAVKTGRCVHAWIMFRKHDHQDRTYFIESSTGHVFPLGEAPYLGVEAVFNSSNYWVNLQSALLSVQQVDLDLSRKSAWECVLNTSSHGLTDLQSCCGMSSFNIPSSWVTKIELPYHEFSLRFAPDGHRTILYMRSKLELFSGAVYLKIVVVTHGSQIIIKTSVCV